jgi:hypothetical protein
MLCMFDPRTNSQQNYQVKTIHKKVFLYSKTEKNTTKMKN